MHDIYRKHDATADKIYCTHNWNNLRLCSDHLFHEFMRVNIHSNQNKGSIKDPKGHKMPLSFGNGYLSTFIKILTNWHDKMYCFFADVDQDGPVSGSGMC